MRRGLLAPNGLGARAFEVQLFTNDADEPIVTRTVTASAVTLPSCDVAIGPLLLDFGAVSAERVLGFTIHNNSTSSNCLVSSLRVEAETGTPAGFAPVFSLAASQPTQLELVPGETRQVKVRAWPRVLPLTPTQVTANLTFNLAQATNAVRVVQLAATLTRTRLAGGGLLHRRARPGASSPCFLFEPIAEHQDAALSIHLQRDGSLPPQRAFRLLVR